MTKGIVPVERRGVQRGSKYNWIEIKRDYLTDPTASCSSLAKKFGVALRTIEARSAREKWALLREEIMHKAEIKMVSEAENEILQVKKRHLQIARLLQKIGIEALEEHKYLPKTSKEARAFIVEGVKIEKQSFGLDQPKQLPAIVNIVNKEKEIVRRYTGEAQEGEIING